MPDRGPSFAVPPVRADGFLEHTLPEGAKGLTILGDLHEEFHDVRLRIGDSAARRWYWRESIRLGVRYSAYRILRAPRSSKGRGGDMLASMIADVRFGFRMLRRTPGLSAVAVLTIAFGVGLTTHMYSSVLGSVVRGLPVPGADRLVVVDEWLRERGQQSALPYREYLDVLSQPHGLESLAGFYQGTIKSGG